MSQSGYVDIHSHILPGIDDGAREEEDTRQLLQAELEEGVTTIIATPHFDMESNFRNLEKIPEKLELTKKIAAELSDDLTIYSGCEILFSQGVIDMLKQDQIPTLAGTGYVLVEFYPSESHKEIYHAMRDIIQTGKTPVLAHVERYETFIRHPEYVRDIIQLGAYIQMNTRSLMGGRFDKRTRFCKSMVKEGMVHFLGSDCHNMEHRPPRMEKTAQIIEKIAGQQRMDRLTSENARILLQGKYV